MNAKLLSICATTVVAAGLAAPAEAGDCNHLWFEITNNKGFQVKLNKMEVKSTVGNQAYTEGLPNKKIDAGKKTTVKGQRLNKIDSGREAEFTVQFDIRNVNGGWDTNKKQTFTDLGNCFDHRIYKFTLS